LRHRLASRPYTCEECGAVVRRRAQLERFRGRWVCRCCLCAYDAPLYLEDFATARSMNATEYGDGCRWVGPMHGADGVRMRGFD
jgi:ribosomal protein L37AE/L43A